jgi:uncharacterized protein (TIGR03382 family)
MLILLACHFSDPVTVSDPAVSNFKVGMYAEPKETGSGGDSDTSGDSATESGGDTSPDTDSGADSDTDSGADSDTDSSADTADSSVGRVGKSAAELAGEPGGFGCSAVSGFQASMIWTAVVALALLLRRRD